MLQALSLSIAEGRGGRAAPTPQEAPRPPQVPSPPVPSMLVHQRLPGGWTGLASALWSETRRDEPRQRLSSGPASVTQLSPRPPLCEERGQSAPDVEKRSERYVRADKGCGVADSVVARKSIAAVVEEVSSLPPSDRAGVPGADVS